jgi:biopolymer transport protein ExbD
MGTNNNRDLIGKSYETLIGYVDIRGISPTNPEKVLVEIHEDGSSKIEDGEISAQEVRKYINAEQEALKKT